MEIALHDEAEHKTAARFLDGWLPVAVSGLTNLLGNPARVEAIHVVLSETQDHQRRFPLRESDLMALLGSEDEGVSTPLAQRFRSELYAHGVATLSAASQQPPAAIPLGAPVIYLDVPTIVQLATDHRVSEEAMLARVAVHELSHVFRGHAESNGKATHGYIKEGDAQRDTWQVLADLLANPEWERLAREGRVAQVRLSDGQPPAYQQFGRSSPDTGRWSEHDPSAPMQWTVRPGRGLLPLSQPTVIEVPVFTSSPLFTPRVGDHVYLLGDGLVVGPWVVVGRAPRAYSSHEVDLGVIDFENRKRRIPGPPSLPEWLHLRRSVDLRAGRDPDVRLRVGAQLLAKKIDGDDRRLLRNALTGSADDILEELADRKRTEHESGVRDLLETIRDSGAELPKGLDGPYDPYSD